MEYFGFEIDRDILERKINLWGKRDATGLLMEELAELINVREQAVCRGKNNSVSVITVFKDDRDLRNHLIEEIGDVYLTAATVTLFIAEFNVDRNYALNHYPTRPFSVSEIASRLIQLTNKMNRYGFYNMEFACDFHMCMEVFHEAEVRLREKIGIITYHDIQNSIIAKQQRCVERMDKFEARKAAREHKKGE